MKSKLNVERDQVIKSTLPKINKGLKKDKQLKLDPVLR
jgi:hypothetical protein